MDINLSFRCGTIKGVARDVTPQKGNRILCFCNDCQKFANSIDREQKILNALGGTEIYQMPLANIEITSGKEQLFCLHVKPKGLFRWYANCCNTPLANTMGANMPFVGLVHNFIEDMEHSDQHLGPVLGYMFSAGQLPAEHPATREFRTTLRILGK